MGVGWEQGWLGAGVGKAKNELVSDTARTAAGKGGGGVGGRGWQRRKRISDKHYFVLAWGSGRQGWGWGWGAGWAKAKTN